MEQCLVAQRVVEKEKTLVACLVGLMGMKTVVQLVVQRVVMKVEMKVVMKV